MAREYRFPLPTRLKIERYPLSEDEWCAVLIAERLEAVVEVLDKIREALIKLQR